MRLSAEPASREPGDSTAWDAAFWDFLSVYLEERFGADYCLSAASSMDVHTGANVIPRQVIALTAEGGKMVLGLPHDTSVLVYQDAKNIPRAVETIRGVRWTGKLGGAAAKYHIVSVS
jgi:hypothetical protein